MAAILMARPHRGMLILDHPTCQCLGEVDDHTLQARARRTAEIEAALPPERLRELLSYNPELGDVRWKVRRSGSRGIGSVARHRSKDGYIRIEIENRSFFRIRQSAYLNNRIEQDHRAIKRRIRPMLGFKSTKGARVILGGIEMAHMMRKGQAKYACNPQPSLAEQFNLLAA